MLIVYYLIITALLSNSLFALVPRQLGTEQAPFLIFQKDLPITINKSGFWAFAEELSFDGTTQITTLGARGAIAIAISVPNVDLSLNNHTLSLNVTGSPIPVNGIATLGNASQVKIHDGTIQGITDNFVRAAGILIENDAVTVKNVQVKNMFTIQGIQIQGLDFESSGIFIQGTIFPSVSSNSFLFTTLFGVIIDRCHLGQNGSGITLANHATSVTIKDTTIDSSQSFGLWQPQRSEVSSNVFLDNCNITDIGFNGVFATFNQTNWLLKNCKIFNCGLTGISMQGCQNLKIQDCQINTCGAYGILQSIRNALNVEISNTAVSNVLYETIRVDNVENLKITGCQCTNYTSVFNSTVNGEVAGIFPLNVNNTSYPIISLQDITNGLISKTQCSSTTGRSDGLFIRNCSSLLVERCVINIYANQQSPTFNDVPTLTGINLLGGSSIRRLKTV